MSDSRHFIVIYAVIIIRKRVLLAKGWKRFGIFSEIVGLNLSLTTFLNILHLQFIIKTVKILK